MDRNIEVNGKNYTIIGPLAYQGKEDCTSPVCTRRTWRDEDGKLQWDPNCIGYHCPYCDEPCSSQGHKCEVGEAILRESERIVGE